MAVAKLARHIRNTIQRRLGRAPGRLQRHVDICQERLHLRIDQTRTPTPTSGAQKCAHLFSRRQRLHPCVLSCSCHTYYHLWAVQACCLGSGAGS